MPLTGALVAGAFLLWYTKASSSLGYNKFLGSYLHRGFLNIG